MKRKPEHEPVEFERDERCFVVRFQEVDKGYSYQPTLEQFEQAGFVRASRLAAAEAEVERGMGIAQGQQIGYEVQLSTARSRITELEAHVSLQRETVETGQRYVSELESKLAAAEAMVEDAWQLARYLEGKSLPSGLVAAVQRILASRPSEQASGPAICGGCDTHVHDCQPLWKQQKKCCPDCSHQPDPELSRIREIETQLAEAKRQLVARDDALALLRPAFDEADDERVQLRADLSAIHDELEQWGFWKPSGDVMSVKQLINAYCELDAKLEAAEAERAHLLEAAELLRRYVRFQTSPDGPGREWLKRDQSRADAATEEPKPSLLEAVLGPLDGDDVPGPACNMTAADFAAVSSVDYDEPQPHPQGARLGGPADKLRADICAAIRKRAPILAQVADELEWLAGVGTSG